ncbi:MAG: hypothetical protein AAB949_00735 [Patescibacteria group bacterium]
MQQDDKNILDLRNVLGQQSETEIAKPQPLSEISWETEEFEYHEKDTGWFLTMGIVFFGIFASLLILKNIFGAATILLFAVIIYLYAAKKPEKILVKADGRGVHINKKLMPYSEIKSFWIHYEPPLKYLILMNKKHIIPKTIVPIGSADPIKLRELLLINALDEKEEEESISEMIFRRLRF